MLLLAGWPEADGSARNGAVARQLDAGAVVAFGQVVSGRWLELLEGEVAEAQLRLDREPADQDRIVLADAGEEVRCSTALAARRPNHLVLATPPWPRTCPAPVEARTCGHTRG